ncbi:hypothetical protein [Streptomyces sp. G45]|uniref:hypothetical protein n=1 Tax=Streptomyces sp. G45 TaxID=3406627 RepID=UPI003C147D65
MHELTPLFASLEEIYTTMTRDSVEYRGSTGADPVRGGGRSERPGGAPDVEELNP